MNSPNITCKCSTREADAEDFDGPLDVILLLLSKNKIEIQTSASRRFWSSILPGLTELKRMDMEVASEFIAMASHFMYIKTRMLLSEAEKPARSEMEELIASLRQRQRKRRLRADQDRLRRAPRFETTSDSACFPNSPSLCAGTRRTAISTTGRICSTRFCDAGPVSKKAPAAGFQFCRYRRHRAVSGGKEGCRGAAGGSLGTAMKFLSAFQGQPQPVRLWRPFLSVLELCGSTRCALKRNRRTGDCLRAEAGRKKTSTGRNEHGTERIAAGADGDFVCCWRAGGSIAAV